MRVPSRLDDGRVLRADPRDLNGRGMVVACVRSLWRAIVYGGRAGWVLHVGQQAASSSRRARRARVWLVDTVIGPT